MQRKDDKKNVLEIYILNADTAYYTYTVKMVFDMIVDMFVNRQKNLFTHNYFWYEHPHYHYRTECNLDEFHTKFIISAVENVCKQLLELEPRISIAFITSDKDNPKYSTSRFISPNKEDL